MHPSTGSGRADLISTFLLIQHGEVLTPFGLSLSKAKKSTHISTNSMRTDFKHHLAESIVNNQEHNEVSNISHTLARGLSPVYRKLVGF
jgi:hypothetical protein